MLCRSPSPASSRDRGDILRHGQALAGKRRFSGLQGGGLDQPRIDRNDVAFFDEEDVARHEFAAGTLFLHAVPDDIRVHGRHLPQRRHRLLGASPLRIAHERVEEDDCEYRDRFIGQCGFAFDRATAPRISPPQRSSRITSASVNWSRNLRHSGTGFSAASSFLPYRSSRSTRLSPGSGRFAHPCRARPAPRRRSADKARCLLDSGFHWAYAWASVFPARRHSSR